MTRLESSKETCAHERLRALRYDERYRWECRCKDCGETIRLTNREWRQRLVSERTPSSDQLGVSDVDTEETGFFNL